MPTNSPVGKPGPPRRAWWKYGAAALVFEYFKTNRCQEWKRVG
ncbi:hypothetical protein [Streptomyces lancefieldiae]|uniref:Transposase n=1 Tax=Streptomyces lancefieldiae TaxID=3075520 RepID=A0ABU3AEU0_9ACTN|nr:hypothetical protein [Streptomyces sp. DSM 40712]MDT0608697.1 hypothetical protein [Streptomyces sp. DSM 40712]